MKRTYRQLVLGLALCALVPLVTAGSKPLVERPFRFRGESTILMNLADGTWTSVISGVGTHAGVCTGTCSGGTGTTTAANGDTLDWRMVPDPCEIDFVNMTVLTTGTVYWEGGTGRFANASGSGTLVQAGTVEFVGPLLIQLTVRCEIVGTIAY
jgi:hypothetical protein